MQFSRVHLDNIVSMTFTICSTKSSVIIGKFFRIEDIKELLESKHSVALYDSTITYIYNISIYLRIFLTTKMMDPTEI